MDGSVASGMPQTPMQPISLLLVGLDAEAYAVVQEAARLAFVASTLTVVNSVDEALNRAQTSGTELLVLMHPKPVELEKAVAATGRLGRRRWPIVVFGAGPVGTAIEIVPRERQRASFVARVFQSIRDLSNMPQFIALPSAPSQPEPMPERESSSFLNLALASGRRLPTEAAASRSLALNQVALSATYARLDALYRTGLLDSPPEEAFDRITALACRLLRVPVALLSLLDDTRQFFKSACGLPEPWATCRETPLTHSFCQHVVSGNAPLRISDASHHPLVRDNPAISALGIVSYLGVPLRTVDGFVLGTLCAIDHQPRAWTDEDVTALNDLVAVAVREIDVRQAFQQRQEAIETEARLSQSLLDSSGDCIQMLDLDGHLLYMNRTGCDLMEVDDMAALAGQYWPDWWSGEAVTAAEAAVARARAGGSGRFQAFCPTLKETPKWWDVLVTAVTDSAGRAVKLLATSRDVTFTKEADTKLRESEERFRNMADHSPVMIWVADLDGFCVYLNRAWYEFTGQVPETALGFGWLDAVHPDDRALLHATVLHAYEHRIAFRHECRLRRQDGQYRWVIDAAAPRFNALGGFHGFIGSVIDIHDRQLAEAALRDSEERLKLALTGADMGVWTWEPDTHAVYWSPEVYRLFGTDQFDGTDDALTRLLHPDDVSFVWNALHAALTSRTFYRVEFRTVQPNGAVRWMASRGRADYTADGRPVCLLGVVLDITDRKLAEQEVERARDEALAAARAKDDFLAALSHELRTPLNPVLLLASEAAHNPALSADVRADFDTIAKNVALEARLIDDLLDLTRITRDKLVLDRCAVDVHAVLRDAIATVQAELQQKRLILSLVFAAAQYTVLSDATRLQQVFWNVLKNAVKFTPAEGQIRVETRTLRDSDTLTVTIADTGIGLMPDELERVFNAFAQGDHTPRGDLHRFGGVGLGLAISRMLVELHSGQISATSAGRGQGATFVIDLPLMPMPAPDGGPEPASQAAAALPQTPVAASSVRRGRILLVEDHTPTRRTLTRLLTRRCYEVTAAASAAAARALASQRRFDLVISDIGLPDGDGCALMAELRAVQPDLAGIALSGYGMEEDLSRSRRAGFTTHLIKPIHIGALERVLANILDTP